MKIRKPLQQAFTLIELLVVIAIIAILASLAVPAVTKALVQGQLTQTVSNGHQIFLATFQMSTDSTVQGDPKLGWPGDLANSTVEPVNDVKGFIERLITYDYLKNSDVIKVCQAPGITPWDGTEGTFNGKTNCAFKIYRVTGGDGASNIFAATQNFTYNANLNPAQDPYKDKGFVVIHKGGDGAAYKAPQAKSPTVLGLLPGRTDFTSNTSESANDYLTQQ